MLLQIYKNICGQTDDRPIVAILTKIKAYKVNVQQHMIRSFNFG